MIPWRPTFGETPVPLERATYPQRHRDLLRQGTHPMTMRPLRQAGGTCGECVHLIARECAKTYHKCARSVHKPTRGGATDCHARWPACELFEARVPPPATGACPGEHE